MLALQRHAGLEKYAAKSLATSRTRTALRSDVVRLLALSNCPCPLLDGSARRLSLAQEMLRLNPSLLVMLALRFSLRRLWCLCGLRALRELDPSCMLLGLRRMLMLEKEAVRLDTRVRRPVLRAIRAKRAGCLVIRGKKLGRLVIPARRLGRRATRVRILAARDIHAKRVAAGLVPRALWALVLILHRHRRSDGLRLCLLLQVDLAPALRLPSRTQRALLLLGVYLVDLLGLSIGLCRHLQGSALLISRRSCCPRATRQRLDLRESSLRISDLGLPLRHLGAFCLPIWMVGLWLIMVGSRNAGLRTGGLEFLTILVRRGGRRVRLRGGRRFRRMRSRLFLGHWVSLLRSLGGRVNVSVCVRAR